jgi:hypothetical protein
VARALPLDDPRWLLLADALKLLAPYSGNLDLAAFDLNQALARKRKPIRCKCRHVRGGHPEPVPSEFWAYFTVWRDGSVNRRPSSSRPGYRVVRSVHELVFFVWRPDLDQLLPMQQAKQTTAPSDEQEPEKLVYVMIRAIAERLPEGARKTAEVLRRIDEEWPAECERNKVKPSGFYAKPDRDKVDRALGRRR